MSDDNPFEIRPGTGDDLFEIAGVLVDTWRSGFRGLLADDFLDGMSREDQAVRHARRMGAPGVNYLVAGGAFGRRDRRLCQFRSGTRHGAGRSP